MRSEIQRRITNVKNRARKRIIMIPSIIKEDKYLKRRRAILHDFTKRENIIDLELIKENSIEKWNK